MRIPQVQNILLLMDIKEDEDRIIVDVDYSLSIEDELLSSSKIRVDVSSK